MKPWRRLLTLGLCLLAPQVWASSLESLYPDVAFVTNRHLPLRLKIDGLDADGMGSVSLQGAGPDDCRVLKDPYRHDLVILLCKRPAEGLFINVRAQIAGHPSVVRFGPLSVKAGTGQGTDPITVPTPTPAPPDGKALTENNCLSCHGSRDNLRAKNLTLSRVRGAILNQPLMGSLNTLTDAQINAIVDYVNK